MPLAPEDWSVVILGHWNRAILTPAWIAKTLFELPEGTPVQVLVSLDTVAPHMVRHEKLTVIPSNDRLVVRPETQDFLTLGKAMATAHKVLEELPRTPVSAVGFNVRYKSPSMVESVQKVSVHEWWDNRLSDTGFKIETRTIERTLPWKNGKIRVFLSQDENEGFEVLLNFERTSIEHEKLREWLSVTAADIEAITQRVIYNSIGLSREEFTNV